MKERDLQLAIARIVTDPDAYRAFLADQDQIPDHAASDTEISVRLSQLRAEMRTQIEFVHNLLRRKRSEGARRLLPDLYRYLGADGWLNLWDAFDTLQNTQESCGDLRSNVADLVADFPEVIMASGLHHVDAKSVQKIERMRLRAMNFRAAEPESYRAVGSCRESLPCRVRPIATCRVPRQLAEIYLGQKVSQQARDHGGKVVLVAFHPVVGSEVKITGLSATQLRVLRMCDGLTSVREIAQRLSEGSDVPIAMVSSAVNQLVVFFTSTGVIHMNDSSPVAKERRTRRQQ
ncbi:hypothetical protein NKH14_16365 [Mesorhizobium sp. M1380]|uniref:hypothetical protein n=1 Tax=Mesorhizobium sp. M1380 TaxID=2957093 RepID=UPI00333C6C0F